jgi:predicted  nucleic acid-binding Zn-ribbon protein
LKMVKSDEYYKKMTAEAKEAGIHESKEEKVLWEKRARMEKKIEQKEKMIHNARERLDGGWKIGVFERLDQEIGMMQEEIGSIRVEITSVDRKIRAVERAELVEAREEAIDLVAEEAKGYAYALGQARQRMERETQTIRELEEKLEKVGRM